MHQKIYSVYSAKKAEMYGPTVLDSVTVLGRVTVLDSWQAFSQDLKSGRSKCAIGPAQMNNL